VASHNYGAKTMARPPHSQQTENSFDLENAQKNDVRERLA